MLQAPLLPILQATRERVRSVSADPGDMVMISRTNFGWRVEELGGEHAATPTGEVFPPRQLDEHLIKKLGGDEPSMDWAPGAWIGHGELVLLVCGASWPSYLGIGADLMRALAARPRTDREELCTNETWSLLDRAVNRYPQSQGLPATGALRISATTDLFSRVWPEFLCELLLTGIQGVVAQECWALRDGKPTRRDVADNDWVCTTPARLSELHLAVIDSLISPLNPSDEPTDGDSTDNSVCVTPDVDHMDLLIMRAIRDANRAITQSELEAATNNTRKTIGKRLQHLREQGFTRRGKQGELLTDQGADLLHAHNPKTTQ